MKGYFQHTVLVAKFLQLAAVTIVAGLMFTMLSLLVTNGDYSSVNALKIAQLLQSLGIFVVTPVLLAYLWSTRPAEWLQIDRRPSVATLLLVVLLMWVAIPGINMIGAWNQEVQLPESWTGVEQYFRAMEANAEALTDRILSDTTLSGVLFTLVVVALVPAVGEELFFRGVIQRLFNSKWNSHIAVWLTAIVFSTIHFQFFGFIPRMLIGALLGYLLVWGGSLWYPIVAHFVNNATIVFVFLADQKGWISIDMEAVGTQKTILAGYLSLVLVVFLIVWVRTKLRTNRSGSSFPDNH